MRERYVSSDFLAILSIAVWVPCQTFCYAVIFLVTLEFVWAVHSIWLTALLLLGASCTNFTHEKVHDSM